MAAVAFFSVSPGKVAAQMKLVHFRTLFWSCYLGTLGLRTLAVLLTPSLLTDCSKDIGRSRPEARGENPP